MDGNVLSPEELGEQFRGALESADLEPVRDLLDPNVRWGAPDDPAPSCQNRDQVIAWYRAGRERGVRASVTEIVVAGDHVLVGLRVTGNSESAAGGETVDRWQVLTVSAGRVVDIRGFDDRREAARRAQLPA